MKPETLLLVKKTFIFHILPIFKAAFHKAINCQTFTKPKGEPKTIFYKLHRISKYMLKVNENYYRFILWPDQCWILVVNVRSFGSFLILSSRVFQSNFFLKDSDSRPKLANLKDIIYPWIIVYMLLLMKFFQSKFFLKDSDSKPKLANLKGIIYPWIIYSLCASSHEILPE